MRQFHYVRAFLLLSVGAVHLAWASPTDDTLRLTITAPHVVIREFNVSLEVSMSNRTTQPIAIIKTSPGCDFSADVRDVDGQKVPLTQAGAELSNCASRLATGRWIRVILKPGESTDETYPVDLYYGLARPGIYRVQLSRELPSQLGGVAKSNEVFLNLAE